MNKLIILIFVFFVSPANAGWFDDVKKKIGIGYQSYDDCIIEELKGVSSKNREVKRAIINKCNKKFPKPAPVYKTIYLKHTNECKYHDSSWLVGYQCAFWLMNETQYRGPAKFFIGIGKNNSRYNVDLTMYKSFLDKGLNQILVDFETNSGQTLYYTKKIKIVVQTNYFR